MNLRHSAIEHIAQLTQLIPAVGVEGHRHVTASNLVHHPTQALEGGAGGGVETAIQVENQHEHYG
ncbi:hypothetical protein D3C78_1895620 [compost metagenome]